MAIAEIVTSIGVGGLFSKDSIMSVFMIITGIVMTTLSLFLNFK